MRNLVIFGAGNIAELANYYFSNDSEYRVVAHTVDSQYIDGNSVFGKPLVAFEEVENLFPPSENDFFVALSYSKINAVRKEKFLIAKDKGYKLASYISTKATILNKGAIGDNAFILEDNTIQPFVKIGSNVTLWSGNHIGHHSVIHDHCFISSHVVISGGVVIGEQSFIGVNSTLRDHIKLGEACVIGAGSLLLSDIESFGVYMGSATTRSNVPSTRLRNI